MMTMNRANLGIIKAGTTGFYASAQANTVSLPLSRPLWLVTLKSAHNFLPVPKKG